MASSLFTLALLRAAGVLNGNARLLYVVYEILTQNRIPSVFWQFLWSTVLGPYVLLRIRNIQDTHYWAWQTRLAIISWYAIVFLVSKVRLTITAFLGRLYGSPSPMRRVLSSSVSTIGSLPLDGMFRLERSKVSVTNKPQVPPRVDHDAIRFYLLPAVRCLQAQVP
jgi:hypothetical protein